MFGYEPKGRGFESLLAYQGKTAISNEMAVFSYFFELFIFLKICLVFIAEFRTFLRFSPSSTRWADAMHQAIPLCEQGIIVLPLVARLDPFLSLPRPILFEHRDTVCRHFDNPL